MDFEHHFQVAVEWQGNRGSGTSGYREYGRELQIRAESKAPIEGSAARAFHGNADRWNPEELLVAALSQCHMLSFLHVAVAHGVVVVEYSDAATGTMLQTPDGGGHFTEVTLHPNVVITEAGREAGHVQLMADLHRQASEKCFIAQSVNFPVHHEPRTTVAG